MQMSSDVFSHTGGFSHTALPTGRTRSACRMARRRLLVRAFFGSGAASAKQPQGTPRRRQLMAYVEEVQQHSVQQFLDQHSGMVANAMLQTTQNIVGTLPPQYFDVTINAAGDSLAELMFRVMLQAYMLRNAQYRMELQNCLAAPVLMAVSTSSGDSVTLASKGTLGMGQSTSSDSGSDTSAAYGGSVVDLPRPAASGGSSNAGSSTAFLCNNTFAPGVQKSRVQGDVLRWHRTEEKLVTMPAADYMQLLEDQLAEARQQLQAVQVQGSNGAAGPPARLMVNLPAESSEAHLARWEPSVAHLQSPAGAGIAFSSATFAATGRGNELLDYIRGLQPHSVQALASGASKDVVDAMHAFVDRLMGTADPHQLRALSSEFSAVDLSKVLVWLMIVGFTLRTMEARFDMEDALRLPSASGSGPGFLPGG